MLTDKQKEFFSSAKLSVFSRLRLQILMIPFFGILMPYILYISASNQNGINLVTAQFTISLSIMASIISIVFLKKISEFPGTSSIGYIFPTYVGLYGIIVVAILLLRAPYSNVILITSFSGSIILQFLVNSLGQRAATTSYFIVPGGRVDRILGDIPGKANMLTAPTLPDDPQAIIVADLHHDHAEEWERAIAQAALRGVPVYHYKQAWESLTGKVRIEHLSENSFGSLIPSLSYAKAKRLIDILLCILIVPIAILPLFVVSILIRLDSSGPAIFRQVRIGYRGQPFEVIKFRTMRSIPISNHTEDLRDASITKDNDSRITKLGSFLRRTRIDELPQIINILRGEMSWIGPRPEAISLSNWYQQEVPFYAYRHIVRPGITGWAQVNQGHVHSIEDINDKLRFDFFYIKNFSSWMDMLILMRTILVVLSGFGAK